MIKPAIRTSIIILLCLCLTIPTWAQLNKLKDKIKIPVKAPQVPDLDKLLQEEPPVSTTLTDAIYDIPFLDGYDPGQGAFMTFLPLSPQAGFPLLPGLWEGTFQSYCLKAGSYAPGEGDGYAYAPLKGKQADIVANILKNSVSHPEIDQQDIQLLLWAIIARSKISECSKEIQTAARALITPKEYDRLNGGALGKIPEPVLNAALQKLPPLAREVFQAEARLRKMLHSAVAAPYHEVESVAVRVGEILPPADSREIRSGRWSYDPDGHFIRYFPHSYHTTRIQLYYPENFTIETDDNGLITAIGDRQGMKIQIVYDQSVEPLFFTDDDNVVGLAFKELILTREVAGEKPIMRSIKDIGWVLAGVPSGGGKPASTLTRFSDASDRYKFAVNHGNEVLELKNNLAKDNPELKQLPDSAAWSVVYLGNYCRAIQLALSAALRSAGKKPDELETAFTGLIYRAWMKGVALLASGELGKPEEPEQNGVSELNITGKVGLFLSFLNGCPAPDQLSFESPAEGKLAAEEGNGFSGSESEVSISIQQRLSRRRELPKFVFTEAEKQKWGKQSEKPKGPPKLKRHELPWFNPNEKVAQPGNTGKQRLGQSPRKSSSGNGREAAENTRKMINWFSSGTSAGSSGIGKIVGPGAATPYGIPKAVAGYTIGRTVGIWGDCIDAISMDPPRNDYTVLARPEPGSFVPIQPGAGVTRARAEAINAFLAAAIDLTAKMRAARFSVERYSGAMIAGDEEWAGRQLENAIRYERESGLAMLVAADRLEALVKVATAEKVPDTLLTPELIDSYRNSLRREGFSPEELEACRSLNLTPEEIEEMKARILSGEPMEGPSSLYRSSLETARALREFARLLLALPVI